MFFIILFQCSPVEYTWTRFLGATGTCLNANLVVNVAEAFSAVDIFYSFVFALIPIPMLWNVQMTVQAKISVLLILGLGVL